MGLEDNKKIMDVFTGTKIYKIPPYQRDYSWKKSQIDDFWNDAESFFDSGDDSYFFGPVVFVEEPKKNFISIVDGQQRLTTLQLLICVIRDILHSNKEFGKSTKCDGYLETRVEEDPALQLNNNNNPYFTKFALKVDTPENKLKNHKTKNHSETRLYENYNRIYKKIKERFLKNQDIEKQNSNVYNFLTKILKGFRVFEITLDSPEKAFRLFATLNHRGLSLTTSDLIKNLIFMNSNESQHSSFHATWESIKNNLDDKNGFDRFLRHSFIAKYKYVTTQSLYTEVVGRADSPEKVKEYLDNLLTDSQIYSEVVSTKRDDTTGFYLESLFKDLSNDSAQSVILNAYKFWNDKNPKDVDKIIKICLDVFFRGKTIGGKAAGTVGKQFAKAARLIATNANFDDVIEELKIIDIPNTEFKSIIQTGTFKNRNPKHLLKTLERFYISAPNTESKGTISTVTLEHILPQKIEYEKNGVTIKTDWLNKESKSYVSKEDHENIVDRIGNLTLLHKLTNSELQNLSFEDKKKKYANETLDITKELSDTDFWNTTKILERCETISNLAIEYWPTILNDDEVKKISEEDDQLNPEIDDE